MTRRNVETYANDQQVLCRENDFIPDSLFKEYGVNRGLRDVNGVGVLTGLTNISKIVAFQNVDGQRVPCEGQLFYRGYNIKNLIGGLGPEEFGFEKIAYLLLFGDLPSPEQLAEFTGILSDCRTLPTNFTRDVIMKAPSRDIMNSMTRSVLTLASYDDKVNGDLGNSIRQCIRLISEFPMLAVYGYHAYNHYENDDSMYIHRPDPNLSTAENILRMLPPRQVLHPAGGQGPGHRPHPPHGARGRQQLHLHHPGGDLLRLGHLLHRGRRPPPP